jgi:hypothetical protein
LFSDVEEINREQEGDVEAQLVEKSVGSLLIQVAVKI